MKIQFCVRLSTDFLCFLYLALIQLIEANLVTATNSISRLVDWSVCQFGGRSIGRSVGRSILYCSPIRLLSVLPANRLKVMDASKRSKFKMIHSLAMLTGCEVTA